MKAEASCRTAPAPDHKVFWGRPHRSQEGCPVADSAGRLRRVTDRVLHREIPSPVLFRSGFLSPPEGGISGDVVELVELLGPAVFQYLVNIEKARTPAT